jgi:hypothetical protein
MKPVKCKSGIMGWQARLWEVYEDFELFLGYCEVYGLHTRLGYDTPRAAWDANPLVQGSVNPSDYRRVKESRPKPSMLHKRGRRIHIDYLDVEVGKEGPAHDPYSVVKYWVGLSNGSMVCLKMGDLSGTVLYVRNRANIRRINGRMVRGIKRGTTSKPAHKPTAIERLRARFEKLTGLNPDRFEKLYMQRFYFEDPMGHPSQYE